MIVIDRAYEYRRLSVKSKLLEQAQKVVQECGEKADCYVGALDKSDYQKKENEFAGIAFVMDLDSSRVSGYFVPFFGHPAKTAAGPIFIGRKTGSPVVPLALFRTQDDRFLLKILPAFDIPVTDNKEEDIKAALLQCNKALEELINYDPTQWIWIHKRWKSKPSPQNGVKDGLEEVILLGE